MPGKLLLSDAASDSQTLIFVLIGVGMPLPVMLGYNLYQYHVLRGRIPTRSAAFGATPS